MLSLSSVLIPLRLIHTAFWHRRARSFLFKLFALCLRLVHVRCNRIDELLIVAGDGGDGLCAHGEIMQAFGIEENLQCADGAAGGVQHGETLFQKLHGIGDLICGIVVFRVF